MFKTFKTKTLASLALILAVTAVGAADSALARQKKPQQPEKPGYWVRGEDGGYEWTGKKSKMPRDVQPTVRDHRTKQPVDTGPQPIVHDHRKKKIFGMSGVDGVVKRNPEGRRNKNVRDHRGEEQEYMVRDRRTKRFKKVED